MNNSLSKQKSKNSQSSEYGKQLQEKQKLKNLYNLKETQFKNIIKKILDSRKKTIRDDISKVLIKNLEGRLDNVIFRLGLAVSRKQARQLVSHSYFFVNGKTVDIPSYIVKKGDVISVKKQKLKKGIFKNISVEALKKNKTIPWINFDVDNWEAKIVDEPTFPEGDFPVNISTVFEFYSR